VEQGPIHAYTGRRVPPVKLEIPQDDESGPEEHELYEIRIINNDYNTYQEVIVVSMVALGVNEAQAFAIAWEVDHYGSCVVAHGSYRAAQEVASVIRTIGIEVQVNPVGGPVS